MNMMDQLHEKTEVASGFVAGGEAELGLVTVQGDKTKATTNHGSGSDSTGSTRHDLVSAVSGFRVLHRRKRMARQRRSSSSTIKLLSFVPSSSTSQVPSSPLPGLRPTLPAREIDPRRLRFLFQKELRNSDVSSLRRMILPKKAAEAHLPILDSKEGILINMDDLDGLHVIQARKASEQDVYSDITRNDANDLFLYDYEPYRPSSLFENYPTDNATSMSFIYDTTTFSNDSPLDFLGGSMTSYSRIGSLEGFGSVDNFSLDDFY
nr:b3 domain-containing transcription factor fus3 [Quercus suber]POE55138.1 b3 domain-containing transcription factor fus3 [Quercus suber]